MSGLRRFAGPAVGFLVGLGLDLSPYENAAAAYAAWAFAGLWGLIALLTWEPVRRVLRRERQPCSSDATTEEGSVVADACRWGNTTERHGKVVQTVRVWFTLHISNPPVNVADVRLAMGDETLDRLSGGVPFTQEDRKGAYEARFALTTAVIYAVPKDRRDRFRLYVGAGGQEWASEEFMIGEGELQPLVQGPIAIVNRGKRTSILHSVFRGRFRPAILNTEEASDTRIKDNVFDENPPSSQ